MKLAGRTIKQMQVSRDPRRLALSGPESGATMTMKPATTLLQIGGFSPDSLPRWKRMFEPYGVEPVMGIPSRKTGVKASLAPGAAIGVQLVSGDMDQTAVGTVTFRWGQRVLAFGHPMFGQGASSMPITTSFIHEIFPSYQRSFKMSSPIDTVGAMQQDTQFAIGGTVGSKADTIPMTVSIREPGRQIAKTYRVRIMKDPLLTPQLIAGVAVETIETTLGMTNDKMVRVGLDMKIDGAAPIKRRNLMYANQSVTSAALNDLGQTLSLTQSNEFARGSIARVDLSVLVEAKRQTARIKSMTADRNRVKAGETVGISVVMENTERPSQTFTKTFQFAVPEDAPSGALRIGASTASNYWGLQTRVGGAPPDPTTLPQLVEAWDRVGAMNELVVMASTPRRFLKIEQQRIVNPPPTFAKLLQSAPVSNVSSFNEVDVRRESTEFMIDGAQFLTIPVESRRHPESGEAQTEGAKTTPAGEGGVTPTAPTVEVVPAPSGMSQLGGIVNWKSNDAPFGESRFLKYLQGLRDARETAFAKRWERMQIGDSPAATPTPIATATPTPVPGVTTSNSGPNQTPTPEPTATATPTATPDSASLARPAQSWVQTPAEFLTGTFEGAQVSSAGRLQLAPTSQRVAQTSEPFVWGVAGDGGGNTYLALANPARVVKITRDGKREIIWTSSDIVVSALSSDNKGNLYAGVSPSGRVFRIESNGKATPILNTTQSFVGAIETDERGRLLVGAGGERARLFRLENPSGAVEATTNATAMTTLEQSQIRAISARGDEIFVGTGNEAVLYRIAGDGTATALYQVGERTAKGADELEILGVAAAPDAVYFGASNAGTIWRWKADEGVTALYPSPQQSVFALRRGANGKLYAGTGDKGVVYEIEPGRNANDTRAARLLEPQPTQALSLALAPDNSLIVGTGNAGSAYRVGLNDTKTGTFTSAILDAKSIVRWGAVRTIGRDFTLETRSGNTIDPDTTWSNWQQVLAEGPQSRVQSPPARYLQYRAILRGGEKAIWDEASANLSRVEFVYRAKNSAPQVAFASPRGGEWLSGKSKIQWQAKDPDSDTLRAKLWLSKDDGATWQSVKLDEPDKDSLDLDTTKYADGTYRARIETTDAARNPDDPQSDSFISLPFVIDNGAPKIENARIEKDGDGFKISAQTSDALSPLAGAVWRWAAPVETKPAAKTDTKTPAVKTEAAKTEVVKTEDEKSDGEKKEETWRALGAVDGLFDSRTEAAIGIISSDDEPLDAKNKTAPRRIEIRAQDAAGNTSTTIVALP